MLRPRRRLLLAIIGGLAAAVAVAVVPALVRPARGPGGGPPPGATVLENLDVYGSVPPFSLVDRSGRTVSRDDLRGTVWVTNFIYTECTETCPTQSLQLARLHGEFADASDLRLVSITVDPGRDTPEVLARYAERHGADPHRWLFLTGDKRDIHCLARGLRLSVVDPADATPPACDGSAARLSALALAWLAPGPALATHGSQGLVMHSARLVLVDRAGRIRAYHLATEADSLERLRPNLEALLAGR